MVRNRLAGTKMDYIRKATENDLSRIAELVIFNYRLNFYPIFKNDVFYFKELQVVSLMEAYRASVGNIWVYDDGVVKGMIHVEDREVRKLFVEPVLQGKGIGAALLQFAVTACGAECLWALEKNVRGIRFYERHGFCVTPERKPEEGTTEYLVKLRRTGI